MEGIKYDQDKADWTLFYFKGLDDVAKVLTYGAKKYAPDNWQKVDKERYQAAAYRHLSAYMSGEEADEETGLSHLSHAMCCLNFLQWHEDSGKICT